jgi:hypothetical protein
LGLLVPLGDLVLSSGPFGAFVFALGDFVSVGAFEPFGAFVELLTGALGLLVPLGDLVGLVGDFV